MENEKKAWQTPELQEMAVVVLSLHQKWWQKMAAGEKVLELRKSKPQCKAPFRVLVYVATKGGSCDMNNAFAGSRLAVMLHIADMEATHLDERKEKHE